MKLYMTLRKQTELIKCCIANSTLRNREAENECLSSDSPPQYERACFIPVRLFISEVLWSWRKAAIIRRAPIRTMNRLGCVLLPAVFVIPDGLMANKSQVELSLRGVCRLLRDETRGKKKEKEKRKRFDPCVVGQGCRIRAAAALKRSLSDFLFVTPQSERLYKIGGSPRSFIESLQIYESKVENTFWISATNPDETERLQG